MDLRVLLSDLGFADALADVVLPTLVGAGLTNGRKERISLAKRQAVAAVLSNSYALSCGEPSCETALRASGREVLAVKDARFCERCGGSVNARAASEFVAACLDRGIGRVVVVGGSPSARDELRELIGDRLATRLVDGTARSDGSRARADLVWAQLVLVWGATQLDHRVSSLYTTASRGNATVVTVARRGVSALLDEGRVAVTGAASVRRSSSCA